MITLTDDERDLLRHTVSTISQVVAYPAHGIAYLRDSHASGGGQGFNYAVEPTRLRGWWKHFTTTQTGVHRHTGEPIYRYQFDPPHREATITFKRLQAWAEELPADIRDRALAKWATDTRDLPPLHRIVLEAVDLGVAGQLELFEVA